MKKTLSALAIGATILTPVMAAAADVKIYGRAHVSLDYLDDGKDYNEVALSSNSSRLGFKVDHQINEDLNVFAQIEQQVNFSSGSDDSEDSVDFATRDTFLGVKGNFGQVKVGRFDSPFKAARGPANFFGDQVGDIRTLTRAYNHRFDERNPNTIEYKTPKFAGGFTATAALSLHDGTMIDTRPPVNDEDQTKVNEKSQAYDLGLNYNAGHWNVAAAYEHYAEDVSRGERDGIRLAAAYKLTPELNVGALYQFTALDNGSGTNADANVFGVGAEYKLTDKNTLRGHVFHRDIDTTDANSTLLALGLEHRLDKQFRVYGNLAAMLNDDNADLTPWSQARSNKAGSAQGVKATGETVMGLSVGMRYDF
ncbi:porin [Acinetobacter sp. YH01008]|uniref:porin n=1 Tax=Acinetobacter sp. YH01008 TaxID=2601024 RepID=UPI0015D13DBE|nr:porin [Acinetobacter sp. YH01008]